MRKPRELQDGAAYHVTARADHQDMKFDEAEIKDIFLLVLKRARRKYDFQLENFCIMGNHVHFMIRPGRSESLSSIMQWILSVFAMAYNRYRHTTGHVWGQRFFSRIIAGIWDYAGVYAYIDENPVDACCVSNRRAWRYGGLWMDRLGLRVFHAEPAAWLGLFFPEHAPFLIVP